MVVAAACTYCRRRLFAGSKEWTRMIGRQGIAPSVEQRIAVAIAEVREALCLQILQGDDPIPLGRCRPRLEAKTCFVGRKGIEEEVVEMNGDLALTMELLGTTKPSVSSTPF